MESKTLERAMGAVDLLVIGGTAAGVAVALAGKRSGLSVFLAGCRPYLGEDLCGDMELWPGAGGREEPALWSRLYPEAPHPSRPMGIKLGLEQSLVEAGIGFYLNAPVAGPLRDGSGRICGALLATRSGLLRQPARLVVDATTEGALARLSGARVGELPRGRQRVRHRTLCHGPGSDADGVELVERLEGFEGSIGEKAYQLSARTYELEVDFGEGTLRDRCRVEAEIALRCRVPEEYLHQERIRLADTEHPAASAVSPEDLPLHDGLVLLTPAAGDPAIAGFLRDAATATALAENLGTWLEEVVGGRPVPPGGESLSVSKIPLLDEFEVLVLGGGTGGAPAGIAASRKGADTLIVEAADQLGGVGTVGQIARYWFGNRVGFTSEVDAGVAALETDGRLRKNLGQWSVAAKSHWYENACHESGATVLFRSLCPGVEKSGNRVTGLYVATPDGFGLIRGKCVIDATGCADVAAAAGAPVREIGTEHVAVQGTGLAALVPGQDYNNSDHNFCDDTDIRDTTAFLVSTKVKFKEHFDAGQLVDSRERRQIVGEITLGPSDFLSNRRYPDTICEASSNFDTHGFTIHPVFMCKAPHKKRLWADVPFRALLPKGLERVLVTGLGVSAHRDALPVIRMQADVQNHGYSAGYAAAVCALTDTDLRNLPIRDIQRHLVETGILPERVLAEEDTFPVPLERLEQAVREEWDELTGLALMFADPERALPLIKEALAQAEDGARRLRYALVLALMDDASGTELIEEAVSESPWDKGWNFTGMGQFGMSLSEIDVLLIALGRIGAARAWPVIFGKAGDLPDDPDFSHCRAVAEACEGLYPRHNDHRATKMLAGLLCRPGMTGHAWTRIQEVQETITDDPNETTPRNRALRELHLARALYRCGDDNRTGETILRSYAGDLRGHFARHARAVLTNG